MMKFFTTILAFLLTIELSAQSCQTLFDDGWTFTHDGKTISVNLPHDWDIYTQPNSGKGATGTGGGWYEAGKGEYRKQFSTPQAGIVKLHFEGVYQKAEVFINGQKASEYTFKMDYYWMQGDNRHCSADSRYWGFVPEDHIVGKPIFIWLSTDADRAWFSGHHIRWNRLFSLVDNIK